MLCGRATTPGPWGARWARRAIRCEGCWQRGRYLVLWRLEPGGAWRIERYVDIAEEAAADSDVQHG
ncbi:MAG TPA: hypothetical protein VNL77_15755 [Roseiflexaceae bacterium]|nr:hypothetical protein [Roseiflexaceae bacterium]